MPRYDVSTNGVCNEILSIRFDIINGYVEKSFCYVVLKLKYDLILGKPWIKKTVFNTILNPKVYGFDFLKWKSKTFKIKTNEIELYANIVNKNLHAVKKGEINGFFFQPAWLISIKF